MSHTIREVSSNVDGPRGKVPASSHGSSSLLPLQSVHVNDGAVNHYPRPSTGSISDAPRYAPSSSIRHTSSHGSRPSTVPPPTGSSLEATRYRPAENPQLDLYLRTMVYLPRLIDDITATFLAREREAVRLFNEASSSHSVNCADLYRYYASPHYMQNQPDITTKMRVILVDWLIDVHKRFQHGRETLFLTVNIIDRFLSCTCTKYTPHYVRRSRLQLVAVSAYLIAAKYEQIIVPEMKELVQVAANCYTKQEIAQTENDICKALAFRFTVPTSYQFASRLLTVMEGLPLIRQAAQPQKNMELLFHLTNFFLEHALLDYNALQFTPSQVGNAAVFLAIQTLQLNLTATGSDATSCWSSPLRQVSQANVSDFVGCAEGILSYVEVIRNQPKFQAVRLKYSSPRCGEVCKMVMPLKVSLQ